MDASGALIRDSLCHGPQGAVKDDPHSAAVSHACQMSKPKQIIRRLADTVVGGGKPPIIVDPHDRCAG